MFSRGEVDFAAHLVFKVSAPVQARRRVAQRLVGDLATQPIVGVLLLFNLCQRAVQLQFTLVFFSLVEPDRRQPPRLAARWRGQHPQHGKVLPPAGPFELMVTQQRRAMGQRRLLSRAQCSGQCGVKNVGVRQAGNGCCCAAQECGHGVADMHVTPGVCVLHRQQSALLLHEGGQGERQRRPPGRAGWCRFVVGAGARVHG